MDGKLKKEQYVCLVCGFNMVGYYPDKCPFCGVSKEEFITLLPKEGIARVKILRYRGLKLKPVQQSHGNIQAVFCKVITLLESFIQ